MKINRSDRDSGLDPSASHLRLVLRIVLTALIARLIVVGFVYPGFLAPGRDHWEFGYEAGKIARSIALGHGFGNPYYGVPSGPTAELGPVLPYIMAGIFKLFGIYTKTSAIAMLSLNSLFSSLTCIPIFYMAKRSFGLREARWAAWTWAFFPYAIDFSANSMWDHALIGLLLTCIVWTAMSLQDSSSLAAWAGAGVLCGLAAVANAVILSVLPFLAGWACYQLRKKGKKWLAPAITAAVLMCAVITPWLVRNYRVFHQPILRDNLALTFVTGNVGDAVHWWNQDLDPCGNPAIMADFKARGELAFMAEESSQAKEFLETHPGIFLRRSFRRFVYMWTGYWSFSKKYLQEETFDPANIPFCLVITTIALIGFREMWRKDANRTMPYVLVVVIFPLVYYFTNPALDYRQAFDPEVITLACCAVVSWRFGSEKAPSRTAQDLILVGAEPQSKA